MEQVYKFKNFGDESLKIIAIAVSILDDYEAQGFDLTLRQLYYQFVARDLLPNKQASYNKLGNIVNDARLSGLIDWNRIVDRTRNIRRQSHWSSPKDILMGCARQYTIDMWEDQAYHIEVWIEKDALIGVIEKVCMQYDVTHFSCRGYVSQSEMWSASQRIIKAQNQNKRPIIIHLGDHDPSGMDMTRDIEDRMHMFEAWDVEVDRIALNYDQIEENNCPPNPAKLTDSRAQGYISEHGRSSWELDALEPKYIENIIQEKIVEKINWDKWEASQARQDSDRDKIMKVAERWK